MIQGPRNRSTQHPGGNAAEPDHEQGDDARAIEKLARGSQRDVQRHFGGDEPRSSRHGTSGADGPHIVSRILKSNIEPLRRRRAIGATEKIRPETAVGIAEEQRGPVADEIAKELRRLHGKPAGLDVVA